MRKRGQAHIFVALSPTLYDSFGNITSDGLPLGANPGVLTITSTAVAPTPELSGITLLATGLVVTGTTLRRRLFDRGSQH